MFIMPPTTQLFALTACTLLMPFIAPTIASPVISQTPQDDDIIPGKYIVTLNTGLTPAKRSDHLDWVTATHANSPLGRRRDVQSGVSSEFSIADWAGYAGQFDETTLAEIRSSPAVASVEPNRRVYTQDRRGVARQNDTTWNLHALSHKRYRPWKGGRLQPKRFTYLHFPDAGEDMWAYVIDSGVRITHEDFEGRAVAGASMVGNPDAPHTDERGHGTHVAGTIASRRYGVCKKCNVVSVKIFDGAASNSDIETTIRGLAWAAANITGEGREGRAVINLSIGGVRSDALNAAVAGAHNMGAHVVVAAGNQGNNASHYSPSSSPVAITVGSIDEMYRPLPSTNYGKSVDIFAPGHSIESLGHRDDMSYHVIMSGTSMAAPHVSGLLLYFKSALYDAKGNPATLRKLKELQLYNRVQGRTHGSPNALAYNGAGAHAAKAHGADDR